MSKDDKQGNKQGKPKIDNIPNHNSNKINEEFLSIIKELLNKGESLDSIKEEFNRVYSQFSKKEEITIPLVFSRDLSVLESIIKYLRENKRLRFSEIAKLLSRDQREMWITYHRAVKKKPGPITPDFHLKISLNIFSNRTLSPLESVVSYLHDYKNLSFSEIKILLNKSYTTIHTSYSRFKKKIKEQNGN